MLSLQDRNWGQFQAFGPEGLFDIHTTSSSIDSIRLIEGGNTTLPYVTRTDKSNGIARFVSDKNSSFGIDKAGTITVGLDTQTAFWQPHDYVTGQNIQVVSADVLTNPHVAAFVIPLLKMQMRAKFNWGGNGATLSRMKTLRIMLPTDMLGEPDWKFMEDYIRERETAQIERCREFLMKRIADIEREGVNSAARNLPSPTEITWRSYTINSVFEILPGKRLESRNRKPGLRPFIGALDNSNGIAGFVEDVNSSLDRNVLGVNYNGNGVCLGFYHPYECIFSDDVKRFRLKNRDGTEYSYLFLKVAIQQQKSKFGYLYKFNSMRMARQTIMLPAADDGQPDYAYMETYGRNVTLGLLKEQLAYIAEQENMQPVSNTQSFVTSTGVYGNTASQNTSKH